MTIRIHIVGTSGSGKSTLARRVARELGIDHIELDDLHWAPGWQENPREQTIARLRERLDQAEATRGGWVICGNYRWLTYDIIWPRRPEVVWLDYSFARVMWQVITRTIGRSLFRKRLWSAGNRESVWRSFFSRESIILWSINTYGKRRREYPAVLAAHPELPSHRLRSPRETRQWLAGRRSAALAGRQADEGSAGDL